MKIGLLSKGLKFVPNKPFHLTNQLRLCVQQFLSSSKLFKNIKTDELLLSLFSNRKQYQENLTKEEENTLIYLQQRTDTIIRPADKNIGIVVIESKVYESKVLQQLNDTEFYTKFNYNPNLQIYQLVRFKLEQLFQHKEFSFRTLKTLQPIKPSCATFYILPKLHKNKCPGRPIISGVQHATSYISKYTEWQLPGH